MSRRSTWVSSPRITFKEAASDQLLSPSVVHAKRYIVAEIIVRDEGVGSHRGKFVKRGQFRGVFVKRGLFQIILQKWVVLSGERTTLR